MNDIIFIIVLIGELLWKQLILDHEKMEVLGLAVQVFSEMFIYLIF